MGPLRDPKGFSCTSLSDSVSLSDITMTLDLPLSGLIERVDLASTVDFDALENEVRPKVAIIIYNTLQIVVIYLKLDHTLVCIKTRPPALFES